MHRKEIVNQEYQRHHHENDRRQERNDGRAKAGKQKLSHIRREVTRMLARVRRERLEGVILTQPISDILGSAGKVGFHIVRGNIPPW
jgi:ribosomal protein L11